MTTLIRRIAFTTLSLLAATVAPASAADLDNTEALEAFVDGVVEALMQTNKSPSGTVAIARNGQLVLARGYGFEDIEARERVEADRTLFRPGSVSKLFTWVSVMQLYEQGLVDLDTDVNEYLETFQIKDTWDEPVTLRHILTHTAGFEDGALGYLIIDDPDRIMPLSESMARYQPERVNPPGKQTAYSNYATAVAGLIVENLSGLGFADYVRSNIFEPLGMDNASFEEPLPSPLDENMAGSYAIEAGRFVEKPFEIISNFGPAGALSATATDMIRFGQAMLNGGELDGSRILRQETVDLMLSRAFSHDERLMGMALGFYEQEQNGVRLVGHGGDTQWFHSYLGIDLENEITFFVSFGSSGGSTVRSAFTPAFYNEYFPVEVERPEAPEDFSARAGRYAGAYGFWRSNFSKIEKALGLGGVVQVAPTEDNTLMLAFADSAKQYAEIGPNLFQELNPAVSLIAGFSPRLMAFQENDAGEITGFVLDGLPFMSLRKLPIVATPSFNFALLGVSFAVFFFVLMRRWYRRAYIRELPEADRSATNVASVVAGINLLTAIAGAVVLSIVGDQLFSGIPALFSAWLVLPIIATISGVYLAYRAVRVWQGGLLAGGWERIRYSVVAACALFMGWFFYYWNILGFQYLT